MYHLAAFFFGLMIVTAAHAADRWVLLATQDIDLAAGEATIDAIGETRIPQRAKEIRLLARRGDIVLSKIAVTFSDGHVHTEERRINLLQGERTRPMASQTEGRIAERIKLEFEKSSQPKEKVTLEIWGLITIAPISIRPSVAASAPKAQPRDIGEVGANVCSAKNICTPVRVFFGTDRKRADTKERVGFSGDRAGQLQLGRAIVTVPRAIPRKRGEISRPTWWEQWVLLVPASGDPAKHFTIPNGGIVVYRSADDLAAAIKQHMAGAGDFKDHAFVFVHGYNVSFDDALYRTAQIAYDLGSDDEPFGTAFLYSWPSAANTTGYVYDSDSARQAVEHLQAFLDIVVTKSGAKHVHLIAHSMGNLALLNALQRFAETKPGGDVINQVILAAPDVDVGEFEKIAERIIPIAKGVTLYASSKDVAMGVSRTVHRGAARAGDVPVPAGPVVVNNMDTIDISSLSTEIFALAHAEYADKKELLNDIGQLLRRGADARPPSKRNINYQRIEQGGRMFWRYAQ